MNANPSEQHTSLAELARDLIGVEEEGSTSNKSPAQDPMPEVELALEDLVSDDNGEIVFFNDSGFRTLSIKTQSSVISDGQAKDHATIDGEDVSGFNYVTFDNGVTLYFEEGLDLNIPQS